MLVNSCISYIVDRIYCMWSAIAFFFRQILSVVILFFHTKSVTWLQIGWEPVVKQQQKAKLGRRCYLQMLLGIRQRGWINGRTSHNQVISLRARQADRYGDKLRNQSRDKCWHRVTAEWATGVWIDGAGVHGNKHWNKTISMEVVTKNISTFVHIYIWWIYLGNMQYVIWMYPVLLETKSHY